MRAARMPKHDYRTPAGGALIGAVLGLGLVAVLLAGILWVGPCGR